MNRYDRTFTNPHAVSDNHNLDTISLRTDSTGRIKLSDSWFDILNEATLFDKLYVQTRHAYGRLVALVEPSMMSWVEENHLASTSDGRLLIRPNSSSNVHAKVEFCECCNSPGRIEFRNEHGLEFLQLCAPNNIKAINWGHFVNRIANNLDAVSCQSRPRNNTFPTVPGNAKPLLLHPSMLATIVSCLSDRSVGFEASIVTTETIHRRELHPTRVDFENNFLEVFGEGVSLQIGLAAARCLFLCKINERLQLYLGGPDNAQLLRIEPVSDKHSQDSFLELMEEFVPELL